MKLNETLCYEKGKRVSFGDNLDRLVGIWMTRYLSCSQDSQAGSPGNLIYNVRKQILLQKFSVTWDRPISIHSGVLIHELTLRSLIPAKWVERDLNKLLFPKSFAGEWSGVLSPSSQRNRIHILRVLGSQTLQESFQRTFSEASTQGRSGDPIIGVHLLE